MGKKKNSIPAYSHKDLMHGENWMLVQAMERLGIVVEQVLAWRATEEGEVVVVLVDGRKLRVRTGEEIH